MPPTLLRLIAPYRVRYFVVSGIAVDICRQGDVLLLIEGQPVSGEGAVDRVIFLVSGVTWSPKVCEVAMCAFERPTMANTSPMPMPARCVLQTRRNRVSGQFECLEHKTSSELSRELSLRFASMSIFLAEHEPVNVDGSLLWSEVSLTRRLGELWALGMRHPLGRRAGPEDGQRSALASVNRLRAGDPFSTLVASSMARSSTGGRASHRGAGRGSRSKIATSGRASGDGGSSSVAPVICDAEVAPAALADPHGAELGMPRERDELDLASDEDGVLSESDLEELAATYDGTRPHQEDAEEPRPPAESIIVDASAMELDATELARALEEAEVPSAASAPDPDDAEPAAPSEEAKEEPPWAQLGPPSATSGYVYFGGRSICRIQRGRPANKVTITCYRHPGCSVLVNAARAPVDVDVYKWLFEIEPATTDMSTPVRQALTARHKAIARERWTASRS